MDITTVPVVVTIAEAEVYRKGCTIIFRGEVTLAEGTSRLIIKELPIDLDEGSIVLRMPAAVTQGQVRVVREASERNTPDAEKQELNRQIHDLERRVENKEIELDAWKDLASKMGGPAALDYLRQLPEMLDRLTSEHAQLSEELSRLSEQRDRQRSREMCPRLEVEVTTAVAGTMPLELSCRSDRAGWTPSYDVLVGALDEPLRLRLKGRVWQHAGGDWTDITLRLSTGTATIMGDLPRFTARYLRKWKPQPLRASARAHGPYPAAASPSGMFLGGRGAKLSADLEEDPTESWDIDDMEELMPPEADITEQATVTTYELPGVQSIFQRHDAQTFVISTTELPATYYHYTFPRREEAAYLVARLESEPSPDVLEQPLAIYLEGSYAGTIRVGRTDDEEGYELPLGRDDRVRVRRTEDVHRSKRLLGGKVTKEHRCVITVENHKSAPVSLVALEQLPVSQDKEIEVTLREGSGATVDEHRGELRWEDEVAAGGRATYVANYAVSHAKGVSVDSFERSLQHASGGRQFCRHCGAEIDAGAVFCMSCGAHL